MTNYISLVPPRLGTIDYPGMCLRFAQSFFGAPARHRSAWHAWQAQKHRHGPEVPWPNVPVLLWFEHWGNYDDGLGPYDGRPPGSRGNWGHVAIYVPGDAIYTSPLSGWQAGQERYANIAQMAAQMNLVYVGFSEDINGLRVAKPVTSPAPIPEPEPEPFQEGDEMSKPLIAQKLDGGTLNTLGVIIEPDGSVNHLTLHQWEFWRDRVGCVPVECKNPGHWEYLMGVMASRRSRNSVVTSEAELKRITESVRVGLPKADVSEKIVAGVLKLTV